MSGVYGETGEGCATPPGSPPTNSVLRRLYARLYIRQPRPTEGCPHPAGEGSPGVVAPYKDSIASPAPTTKSACGKWATRATCEPGEHHFAKRLYCMKESCPTCGQDNSAAHRRRWTRMLSKLQQISRLGYLVIEWPDRCRYLAERGLNPDPPDAVGWCRNKQDLKATATAILEVLGGKRVNHHGRVGGFFHRGLLRWHWFGDKLPGKWNPHLNVFVDGGHLEPARLEAIKAELRAALHVPDLIVHYSYCRTPGQMLQKLRYITRATFRNYAWDPYMAEELWKFQNTRWWGDWNDTPVWELKQAEVELDDLADLEAVIKLQQGICPDCGLPLKVIGYNRKTGKPLCWSRPVESTYLLSSGAQAIAGTSYYREPHEQCQGSGLSPPDRRRLAEMWRKHRLEVLAALEARRLRQSAPPHEQAAAILTDSCHTIRAVKPHPSRKPYPAARWGHQSGVRPGAARHYWPASRDFALVMFIRHLARPSPHHPPPRATPRFRVAAGVLSATPPTPTATGLRSPAVAIVSARPSVRRPLRATRDPSLRGRRPHLPRLRQTAPLRAKCLMNITRASPAPACRPDPEKNQKGAPPSCRSSPGAAARDTYPRTRKTSQGTRRPPPGARSALSHGNSAPPARHRAAHPRPPVSSGHYWHRRLPRSTRRPFSCAYGSRLACSLPPLTQWYPSPVAHKFAPSVTGGRSARAHPLPPLVAVIQAPKLDTVPPG